MARTSNVVPLRLFNLLRACGTRLLDASGKPSEVFSRVADALFFYIDQNCDVPNLRNTGVIEPLKYVWMSLKMGCGQEAVCLHRHDISRTRR